MIVMIDMGVGNLDSVRRAFARVGGEVSVTREPDSISNAASVILPGVGAFGDGMAALRKQNLIEPLRAHATAGKPLLGICLGMQLLADASEEHGEHQGLGLVPGRVVRFDPQSNEYRVPNMGWCDVTMQSTSSPFDAIEGTDSFYFAHSYHLRCDDPSDVAATIEYDGSMVTAAVQRQNIVGVQFHPEKSQDAGLQILDAFVEKHVGRAFLSV